MKINFCNDSNIFNCRKLIYNCVYMFIRTGPSENI